MNADFHSVIRGVRPWRGGLYRRLTIGSDELSARADALIARIGAGETSISVNATGGPDKFREETLSNLSKIAHTATGYSLLSELVSGGWAIEISYGKNNQYVPRVGTVASPDGSGVGVIPPGNPQPLTFDPFTTRTYQGIGADPNQLIVLFTDSTLFHELVHAYHDMTGRKAIEAAKNAATGMPLDWKNVSAGSYVNVYDEYINDPYPESEVTTAGTFKLSFQREYYTENKYRVQAGLPLRASYGKGAEVLR